MIGYNERKKKRCYIYFCIFRNLNISHIFSSSEQLKCMIASLVYAGARIDRDENHVKRFKIFVHQFSFFCSLI